MKKAATGKLEVESGLGNYGKWVVKHLIPLLLTVFPYSTAWALQSWQPDINYQIGDMVSHNDQVFVSTLWNKGNLPNEAGSHWQGWVESTENIDQFEFGKHYDSGDLAYVNGELYLSKWGNTGERPVTSWYWRKLARHKTLDVIEYSPLYHSNPKSSEAILGQDRNDNSIKDDYEVAIAETYKSKEFQRLALNMSYVFRAIHQLELDESINLLEEEATDLFASMFAWETCMEDLQAEKVRISNYELELPLSLYIDDIYSALYFRLGQNEAFRDLNGDYDFYDQSALKSNCQNYDVEAELMGS